MARLPNLPAMAPGCRGPAARFAAERHLTALATLDDTPANARRRTMHRNALSRLARAALHFGLELQPAAAALAQPSSRKLAPASDGLIRRTDMDRSEEAKAQAAVLSRTLETVCRKMMGERGLTPEQVGLALGATSLTFLHEAWTGPQIVEHLSDLTLSMATAHGVDPETNPVAGMGRPN